MCKTISTFAVALLLSMTTAVGQKGTSLPTVQKNADVAGDTLHLIGHSHMDMNWLWTLSETQKMSALREATHAGITTAMNSVEISPVNLYVRACSVFPMSVPTVRIFLPVNCLNFSIKRKRHRPTGIIM